MNVRIWVFVLCAAGTPLVGQQGRRAMTTDDALNMVRIEGAQMSPDGRTVFYGLSELDWAGNKRKTTYYVIPASGGEAHQYIGEAGGSAFQFSPNGTYLSFRRKVDDDDQLFIMRTGGGEAVQLTEHESSIGRYQWTDDERRIVFVASVARADEEEKEFKNGNDAIFVDEGPNGQGRGSWNNLWSIDVTSKQEAKLTSGDLIVSEFDVSPDGNRIVYTARFENGRNDDNLSEIYLLDVASGSAERLTDNRVPEDDVRWAPDGVRIAYTARDDEEWELRQPKIWVMDTPTKAYRLVSGGFEGRISRYEWAPDGATIVFNALQRTNSNVYRVSVTDGSVRQLTDVSGQLSMQGVSEDGRRMVYTFENFDTPPDLYTAAIDGSAPVRLTHANRWIEDSIALAAARVIRWTSSDGLEIEGVFMLPLGYAEGDRVPLLLHIHGGPQGFFDNSFRASAHVWGGLGYAQLMPNVRGSSGYTDELLRGNMYDIGGGDFDDLMTGVDHVIEAGYVDAAQMGVRGWSYGGILGGWTITHTDRFKGASLGAMVSDWTSEYGPGWNYDVRLWYIGGTPWDNAERYREMSALTHVGKVTTPTLLLHGMNDVTDTEPQSMMFYKALKDQGKAVRYIRFPREPHGFREPRHQRIRDVEEIRWIQKYVRGIEWTPWERPAPATKAETPTT